ncbi:hypothetical protein DdX_02078 [Ditylenchus destructor]|uniref:Protein quiver n=1 Tax=Ditylenchus destructor TaxID=166010 RepID=A0AAD4NC19_9BILA|nr:hypothetical protein DdX_02078 [Ditylenchus destructor]
MSYLIVIVMLIFTVNESEQQHAIRCYSCTTLNADRLLSDVTDNNWKRWLENPVIALRSGVQSQECEDGVCLKMWFKENGDCTRISSSQGEMEVCTCDGNLCNGVNNQTFNVELRKNNDDGNKV